MTITIQELFAKIPPEKIKFQMINGAIMQADSGSKRTPPSIKIGVAKEVANNFLSFEQPKEVGMLIMIDREDFDKARKELIG